MKLLADFNADDMANKLAFHIKEMSKRWNGHAPINVQPTLAIDHLTYEMQSEFSNKSWNHRHKQQALIKCLKLLSKLGIVEFVSLTKTKLTLGFIHIDTNVPFKLNLDKNFEVEFAGLIQPKRYLKYGEWKNNCS